MDGELAYHAVAHAMENAAGISPGGRFALSLRHAVTGHVPHIRYRLAAEARGKAGASTGALDRSIGEWLSTDLNPATRAMGTALSPANVVWGFNAYNASAKLGARTSVELGDGAPSARAKRELVAQTEDHELCGVGTMLIFDHLVSRAAANSRRGSRRPQLGVLEVGRLLGVEFSAAFHVAQAVADLGPSPPSALARLLGCSERTLRRALAEDGLNTRTICMALRLAKATDMLMAPELSLAAVAQESGFADLSHMSRAFKASCGMPPSLVRAMAAGGACAEPALAEPLAWGAWARDDPFARAASEG